MRTRSDSTWRHQGSTLLVDAQAIGELARDAADNPEAFDVVSLRMALHRVAGQWPGISPGTKRTILVAGLHTLLVTLSAADGERWLRHRVQPLITGINKRWPQVGVVFLFPVDSAALDLNFDEDLSLRLPDRSLVGLSKPLWSASANHIAEIVGENRRIGFHLDHVS